jgi:hypothetical protein
MGRQEVEFETSLGYIVKTLSQTNKNKLKISISARTNITSLTTMKRLSR